MEPLISLLFQGDLTVYQPGDELTCEYQIDAVEASDVQAVEASVLWHTDGKGDVDMAVHHFERRTPSDLTDGDLRELRRFTVRLPNSPLSYSGEIVKIRWCARVRVFLRGGKECFFERPFQLGPHPERPAAEPPDAEPPDSEPPDAEPPDSEPPDQADDAGSASPEDSSDNSPDSPDDSASASSQ